MISFKPEQTDARDKSLFCAFYDTQRALKGGHKK
jgi:hypothetical protein